MKGEERLEYCHLCHAWHSLLWPYWRWHGIRKTKGDYYYYYYIIVMIVLVLPFPVEMALHCRWSCCHDVQPSVALIPLHQTLQTRMWSTGTAPAQLWLWERWVVPACHPRSGWTGQSRHILLPKHIHCVSFLRWLVLLWLHFLISYFWEWQKRHFKVLPKFLQI